jgi:hypothetical protein
MRRKTSELVGSSDAASELDVSLGGVEAVELRDHAFNDRGAEREHRVALLGPNDADERPVTVAQRRHAVARALLGLRHDGHRALPIPLKQRARGLVEAGDVVSHLTHADIVTSR